MGTQAVDPRSVLQAKEQELSQLRETALAELESKLREKENALADSQSKFDQLRADFEYNLHLLKDRDEELHQFEDSSALQAAVLADREKQLAELQASYDEVYAALKSERSAREEEALLFQTTRLELQRQVEDEQLAGANALRQATEQHDQARRALQRSVAEAEEARSRQEREMSAGFTLELQRLEMKYRQMAEDAQQETTVHKALAEQRAAEAQAAHAREMEQLKATEAALAEAKRQGQALKAVSFELEATRKLKEDAVSELTNQNNQLKHQLKMWAEEADAERVELSQRLSRALTELAEVRDKAAADMTVMVAQHDEQVALLKQKLEQAQSSVDHLGEEVRELRSAIKSAAREQQEQLATLERAQRQERESAAEALASQERKLGGELRQAKEQLWARDEEVKVLRDRVAELRRTLDERRADLLSYKDQVLAAGEREAELHRRLLTAELQLEDLGARCELSAESHHEEAMRKVVEQRDAAHLALQDAQSRLLDKEVEVQVLKDALLSQSNANKVAITMQAAAAAAVASRAARPAAHSPSHLASASGMTAAAGGDQGGDGEAGLGRLVGASEGGGRPGGGSRLTRPSPLQLVGLNDGSRLGNQGSQDVLGEGLVMPSPLTDVPLSAQSSAAFLAGVLAGSSQAGGGPSSRSPAPGGGGGGGGAALVAASATAAAIRAATYLRTSKDEVEALLQQQSRSDGGEQPSSQVVMYSPGSPRGLTTVASLRAALQQAEAQNHHLRHMLGVMREEMESLQQATSAAAAAVVAAQSPEAQPAVTDTGLLVAELQASDDELQQALQHIRVLQGQISLLQSGQGQGQHAGAHEHTPRHPAGGAEGSSEVAYLRYRVEQLGLECRQLRRQALQLKAAAGSTPRTASTPEAVIHDGSQTAVALHVPLGPAMPGAGMPVGGGKEGATGGPSQQQGQADTAQQQDQMAAASKQVDETSAQETGEQLQEAQQLIERLQYENEQLMDMSNALRAERDRLASHLMALQGVPPDTAPPRGLYPQPYNPTPHLAMPQADTSPQAYTSFHLPGHMLSHQAPVIPLTHDNISDPGASSALSSILAGAAGAQATSQQLRTSKPSGFEGSRSVSPSASPHSSSPTRSGTVRYWMGSGSMVSSPTAGDAARTSYHPHRTTSPTRPGSGSISLTGTVATASQGATTQVAGATQPQNWRQQQRQSTAEDTTHSGGQVEGVVMGQQLRLVPPAGATSISALHGYVLSGESIRQQPMEHALPQPADLQEPLPHDDVMQGGGPVAGADGPHQPAGLPGTASARETASQRAKLRSLQRRRDRMSQPVQTLDPTPRVRNWNKRDD